MNGPLIKLQQAETEILRALAGIFKEHGLRWYLGYGSALGAVRHGGFIPWDDDIDIIMPRRDYDRFLELLGRIDAGPFRRFDGVLETCVIVHGGYTLKGDGIKIPHPSLDIFPIYGLPEQKAKRALHILRLWFNKKLVRLSRFEDVYGYFTRNAGILRLSPIRLAALKLVKLSGLYRLFDYGRRWAAAERLLKKYDFYGSAYCWCLWGPNAKRDVHLTATFGGGAACLFGGVAAALPRHVDRYLKKCYGDYRTPPPVSAQKPRHDIKGIYEAVIHS